MIITGYDFDEDILKPVEIRINLSSHLVFGRCKFCGSGPTDYYYVGSLPHSISPRSVIKNFDKFKFYMKRLCYDFYLSDVPSNYYGISFLSHSIRNHKYSAREHKNRWKNVDDVREFLACKCGRTSWAFSERAAKNRPEVFNRKSRGKFPKNYPSY